MNILNPVTRLLARPAIRPTPAPAQNRTAIERSRAVVSRPMFSTQPGTPARMLYLPLDEGPDAPQILAYLNDLALRYAQEPFVREFTTHRLANKTRNNDIDGQVRQVTSFVRDNLRYVADPLGTEYVISPVILLQEIMRGERPAADCDDHVLLLNSMLGSLGIETRPIGVKLYTDDHYDHVISTVKVARGWIDIDPTVKSGEQPEYSQRLLPA